MTWDSAITLLQTPHLLSAALLLRDLRSFVRIHFLHAAFEAGILKALAVPMPKEQLLSRLGVQNRDLLEPFLELGVNLGELGLRKGLYSLRGRRARALAAADGDPLAAWLQETVSYHGSVYRHFAERTQGHPLGDYLAGNGSLIARSSRIFEPYVSKFAQSVVERDHPLRLLEIGCGSGVYLRHAAHANPKLTGTAIDLQTEVVREAQSNLAAWGIADRFVVRVGNILTLPPELNGPYDVATLYNNIYYFPVEARAALFGRIRSLLTPRGVLALVSSTRDNTIETANFDLVLRSTVGCAPLPALDELVDQLHQGGFRRVKQVQLVPGVGFYGVLAYNEVLA